MISSINIHNVRRYFLEKEKKEAVRKIKERENIILELKRMNIVWEKYKISKVYLFGAISDLSFNEFSDIDIALEPEVGFAELLQIYTEVSKYFKREIDLRLLKELPFADKIKKIGLVIYERENSYT